MGKPDSIWAKISYNDFKNFAYSRLFQIKFIRELGYTIDTRNESIDFPNADIEFYQAFLLNCFIRSNIRYGSSILCIGSMPKYFSEDLSKDYKLFSLPEPSELINKVVSSQFVAHSPGASLPESVSKQFDCIFTMSGLDDISFSDARNSSVKLILNLKNMLAGGAHCYLTFESFPHNNEDALPPLAYFLFKHSALGLKPLIGFTDLKQVISDKQTARFKKGKGKQSKGEEEYESFSYNLVLQNEPEQLELSTFTRPHDFLKSGSAYIFHHLIKCGGSSLVKDLVNWFGMEYDHILAGAEVNGLSRYRFNTNLLTSDLCITSHFHYNGFFVAQRYPELLDPKFNIRLFTFVREPLKFQISLYYFAKKKGDIANIPLSKFLTLMPNYMSTLFPCDEANYREVLDRYFFIGILERMQESVDKLAALSGKRGFTVKKQNVSPKDEQQDLLDDQILKEFKEINQLDYKIYDYCVEKFNRLP